MAPNGLTARIALLTPGPYNETYFEHAYLARYLGLESGRRQRPDRARPKALSQNPQRPERVDALIKRMDDEWLTCWSCAATRPWAYPACCK